MPQISKKKLDKIIEQEMFSQFWNSLARLNSAECTSNFFSDLLTETEKTMLAKRFTAAILITRGKSATDIRKAINLTYTTIGTVAGWVKNAKPKTRELLMSISKEKDWEVIMDKIDTLLDQLPPAYGTNWHEAGVKKHQNALKRSAKLTLR